MSAKNSTEIFKDNVDWISDSSSYFISIIVLQMIIKIPARVFGIVTNLLTLLVFLKCGLRDGISFCFMSLTLSDQLCLLASLLASILGYLDLEAHVKPYVSLFYVSYIFPFYGLMFYNISTMITVFLAIQKCCCIVLPLNFRNYFSRRRCVATVCCIYCAGIVLYIPFTVTAFPFKSEFDYSTNSTRLVFAWSPVFLNNIFPMLKAINYISIPFSAEIAVLISTVILTIGLKKSAKFRDYAITKNVSNYGNIPETPQVSRPCWFRSHRPQIQIRQQHANTSAEMLHTSQESETQTNTMETKSTRKDARTEKHSLAKKEIRATLAVNVVAIFFVATNTPECIVFLASLLDTSFSAYGNHYNTYKLCLELEDLLHVVNLSVNLFIYLKFNTKFADTFKAMFLRCPNH